MDVLQARKRRVMRPVRNARTKAPPDPSGSAFRFMQDAVRLPPSRTAQEESALGFLAACGFLEARLETHVEGGTELPARACAPDIAALRERHARIRRKQAAHGVQAVAHLGVEARAGRLTEGSIRRIIILRARDAGVEGRVSGHSLRVDGAQSLATAGVSLVEMQVAGRQQAHSLRI